MTVAAGMERFGFTRVASLPFPWFGYLEHTIGCSVMPLLRPS
jgi:hypothetical protein